MVARVVRLHLGARRASRLHRDVMNKGVGMSNEIVIFRLSLTCDELFFLVDTADHNGFHCSDEEIREHIRSCEVCFDVNCEVL